MSLTLDQLRDYHREGKSKVVLNHIKARLREDHPEGGYRVLYAEILLDKGQLMEASVEIDSLLQTPNISTEDYIKLNLMKAEIFTDQGNFSGAQKILKEIKAESGTSSLSRMMPKMLMILGKLHYYRGNLEIASKFLIEAKAYLAKLGNMEGLGRINTLLAQIAKNKGNFNETLDFLSENEKETGLSYLERLETSLMHAQLHVELANLDEGELMVKQIESKIKEMPFMLLKGIVYQMLGNINKLKGKYSQALVYLNLAEDIYEKEQFKYFRYQVYQLIGEVNLLIGNFSTAVENFQKALSIATQLENVKAKALVSASIAKIVQFQGNLSVAEDYLWNALNIIKDSEFPIVKGKIMFSLGSLLFTQRDIKNGRLMIEGIQKIFAETKSPMLNLYMSYLQGLQYFYKPRFIDKELAKQTFLRILKSADADQELKINAALRASQLLIIELKMSESQELLEDLNEIERTIDEIAQRENSLLLRTFLSVLQAKISLINFDIQRSKEIINNMKSNLRTAENNFLLRYLEQEEENMENEFLKWYDAMKKNPSFIERLEKTQVIDYINEISKLVRF